jgi:hypothetical protein
VAEWSCSGLQSRVRRFDSDLSLQPLGRRRPRTSAKIQKTLYFTANYHHRRPPTSIDRVQKNRVLSRVSAMRTTRWYPVLELTDTTIRGVKPREKAYKLRDG